jgi:hypothetical protein
VNKITECRRKHVNKIIELQKQLWGEDNENVMSSSDIVKTAFEDNDCTILSFIDEKENFLGYAYYHYDKVERTIIVKRCECHDSSLFGELVEKIKKYTVAETLKSFAKYIEIHVGHTLLENQLEMKKRNFVGSIIKDNEDFYSFKKEIKNVD